jgi:hypothetical protein
MARTSFYDVARFSYRPFTPVKQVTREVLWFGDLATVEMLKKGAPPLSPALKFVKLTVML